VRLEDDWRPILEGIARAYGWPTDAARLAPKVAALSQAYNTEGVAPDGLLPARLLFSFARDVPKATAAVRELELAGDLTVLDVGAGLGATTYGLARALSGGRLACTWVDTDARAMELGAEIVRARPVEKGTIIELRERRADLPRGTFDLILLGQVLSEVKPEEHLAFVERALDRLADHGSLVIIEPALRERARRLHELRARLLEEGRTIFAPCLHSAACPMLARETDWCHEDLPVDLPDWLVPMARAAGLRWQGLTFAYLIVRKDARSHPGQRGGLRAVSSLIRTKGKSELLVCGEALRGRLTRLDRERDPANAAWDDVQRGDILSVDPPPDPEKPRVSRGSKVIRKVH
jgi:SAM-dependent methyltransferase